MYTPSSSPRFHFDELVSFMDGEDARVAAEGVLYAGASGAAGAGAATDAKEPSPEAASGRPPLRLEGSGQLSFASYVDGSARVGKYREGALNEVRLVLSMFRLRAFTSDVLVIVNSPLRVAAGSAGSAAAPVTAADESAEALAARVRGSLELKDTGLFTGPRE